MSYRVKLDNFEGPLDLLLYLVEKEQIDILEVSLATVVDQFLDYLAVMEACSLEIAGSFLVMAATLLEIKSRRVLPSPPEEVTDGETVSEVALVERLLQYKQFKEAAQLLAEREGRASLQYVRIGTEGGTPDHVYREVSLFDLLSVVKGIVIDLPARRAFAPARSVANVMALIQEVRERLAVDPQVRFRDLLAGISASRVRRDEVVAMFLAVLELMRLKEVVAVQEYLYGEILLVKADSLVPLERDARAEEGAA